MDKPYRTVVKKIGKGNGMISKISLSQRGP